MSAQKKDTSRPPKAHVSAEDIAHLAKLSALKFDTQQVERMQNDLGRIIDFVGQLDEITADENAYASHIQDASGMPHPETPSFADADKLLENVQHPIPSDGVGKRHITMRTSLQGE